MKALTICQPHAHLIWLGPKRVENRTWSTNYRGPLAIHAGKSRDWLSPGDEERWPNMAFGAVTCVADLVACLPIADIRSSRVPPDLQWVALHEHTEGPWCLVLNNLVPLSAPIPCRGYPGLWDLPADLAAIVAELAHPAELVRSPVAPPSTPVRGGLHAT